MTCRYKVKEHWEYLTGEMDEASRSVMDGHVATCTRCRAELAAYSRLLQGLQNLPYKETPKDLTESIVRTVFQRPTAVSRRESASRRAIRILAAAALVISFLLAGGQLAGRAGSLAWSVVSVGWDRLTELGMDAVVVLVSFSKIVDIAARLFNIVGRVLNPEALLRAAFPVESILLIFGFMLLSVAILWRIVGHPESKTQREVHHVHS
ncbi:MAG: hypothetical protein KJ970_13090 [Candidatus Eisenbacteria bacterium]|uniref:Putative zinc-finger domain-containing protein n=1 Tax=Eiseniibacteriota bacterium TaxID=2212470 RepID=A0A948RVL8_UNCEI|nr:hypothetical protein [Candidatus Eisenbacteria bacterium]MBU1947310.1 hypothetical protein [Candidatus Eisenbacteria bacterium]MBU2691850.1 hypothetical protein [Candidatus Eisenbacteria bacterium]